MSAAEDDLIQALKDQKTADISEQPEVFLRIKDCILKLTDAELRYWEVAFKKKRIKDVYDEVTHGLLQALVRNLKTGTALAGKNLVSSNWVIVAGKRIDFSVTNNCKMHMRDIQLENFHGNYTVKYKVHREKVKLNIKLCYFRLSEIVGNGNIFCGFTFAPSASQVGVYRQLGKKCKDEKRFKDISENSIETDAVTWREILSEVSEYVKTTNMPCLLLQKEFVEKTLQGKLALKIHGDSSLLNNTGSSSIASGRNKTVAQPDSVNLQRKIGDTFLDEQDESTKRVANAFGKSTEAAGLSTTEAQPDSPNLQRKIGDTFLDEQDESTKRVANVFGKSAEAAGLK